MCNTRLVTSSLLSAGPYIHQAYAQRWIHSFIFECIGTNYVIHNDMVMKPAGPNENSLRGEVCRQLAQS